LNRSVLVGLGLIGLLLTSCQESTSVIDQSKPQANFSGVSSYGVSLSINATGSTFANVSARIFDSSSKLVKGATITVDQTKLAEASTGGYFIGTLTEWLDGSCHSYTITTPDGQSITDTISKPVGSVTGVTYFPAKPTIATSYKVSPPAGGWPTGSYLFASLVKPGPANYGIARYAAGDSTVTFTSAMLDSTVVAVSFYAALRTTHPIPGYSRSTVEVIGTSTSW